MAAEDDSRGSFTLVGVIRSLEARVAAAARKTLARQDYVSLIDVCVGIGWLRDTNVDDWRRGRVGELEEYLPGRGDTVGWALAYLYRWADSHGLKQEEGKYLSATRGRRQLRFTFGGDPLDEQLWRIHWISDSPSPPEPPDLVVVEAIDDWTCAECGRTGDMFIEDDGEALCLICAEMDHLVFLADGDGTLTYRATQFSVLSAVVMHWSRISESYLRQGILIEDEALDLAEQRCLTEEDARLCRDERESERRAREHAELQAPVAAEVARRFPNCPPERAAAIARHVDVHDRGRVGGAEVSHAGNEQALMPAVITVVRHLDTAYDSLLMSGFPREIARDRIRPAVDRTLADWS
jgi:hypothetical protein